MSRARRAIGTVGLCLATTWLVAVAYNLGYFYRTGAAVYDAGWFAWLATHADRWPMPNPGAIGGNFLAVHMSPIFFLTTFLLRPLASLPHAVTASAALALWAPILFGAVFLLLARHGLGPGRRCATALLLTFNGLMLSMIGFPHIEIFIPALGLLAIALALSATGLWQWVGAAVAFGLTLSIREDAGFHLALPLLALAAVFRADSRVRNRCLALAALGLLAGLAALATQRLLVPAGGQALGHVYLGQPPLAHLSASGIVHRLGYWATRRAYIFAPLLMLLAGAKSDRRLLWGIAIALPWLGLSLIAATQPAGDLWDYYCFPLVASLFWPLLLTPAAPHPRLLRHQTAMGAVSTALFVLVGVLPFVGDGGSHDRRPWMHLIPPTAARITATEAALADTGDAILDDGAATLALGHLQPWQHRLGLGFSDADLVQARRLIRFTTQPAFLAPRLLVLQRSFPSCAAIAGTDLERCTR